VSDSLSSYYWARPMISQPPNLRPKPMRLISLLLLLDSTFNWLLVMDQIWTQHFVLPGRSTFPLPVKKKNNKLDRVRSDPTQLKSRRFFLHAMHDLLNNLNQTRSVPHPVKTEECFLHAMRDLLNNLNRTRSILHQVKTEKVFFMQCMTFLIIWTERGRYHTKS